MAELGDFLTVEGHPNVEVHIDMLDYEYVKECTDQEKLRAVISVLKSGKEGFYPDLVKFAEDRLLSLLPPKEKARILRLRQETSPADIAAAESDLSDWIKSMSGTTNATSDVKERKAITLAEPVVTSTQKTTTTEVKENKNSTAEKEKKKTISGYDFRAWEKFDVDAAVAEIEEDEGTTKTSKKGKEQPAAPTTIRRSVRGTGGETEVVEDAVLSDQQRFFLADRERAKGNECYKAGELDASYNCYSKSLEYKASNQGVIYINRAMVCLKLENWARAENDCTDGLRLLQCSLDASEMGTVEYGDVQQQVVKGFTRRGMCRSHLGRYALAIDDFTAAMDHMAEKYAKLYGDMEKATTKSQREYLESLVTTQMQQQSKCEQLLTQAHESYLQSEGRPYTKGAGQRNLSVSDGTFAVVPTDVCHWSEFFESFGDEESGLDIGDYTLFGEGECVDGGALQEASEFTRISIALDDDSDSETEEIVEDFVVVNSPKPTNDANKPFTRVAIVDDDSESDEEVEDVVAGGNKGVESSFTRVAIVDDDSDEEDSARVALELKEREQAANKARFEEFKNRGDTAMKGKKAELAVQLYTQCLSVDPSSVAVLGNRAMAYINLQQYEHAVEDTTSLLVLDPINKKAHYRRAVANEKLGQLLVALADIEMLKTMMQADKQPITTQISSLESLIKSRIVDKGEATAAVVPNVAPVTEAVEPPKPPSPVKAKAAKAAKGKKSVEQEMKEMQEELAKAKAAVSSKTTAMEAASEKFNSLQKECDEKVGEKDRLSKELDMHAQSLDTAIATETAALAQSVVEEPVASSTRVKIEIDDDDDSEHEEEEQNHNTEESGEWYAASLKKKGLKLIESGKATDIKEALALLEKAVEVLKGCKDIDTISSQLSMYHVMLTTAKTANNHQLVVQYCNSILKDLDANNFKALLRRGEAQLQLGNASAALADASRALRIDGSSHEAMMLVHEINELKDAEEKKTKGTASTEEEDEEPTHTHPGMDYEANRLASVRLKEEGNELMKQKNYVDAIDCYSQSISLDKHNLTSYCNRAQAYLKNKDFVESRDDATKVIDAAAKDPSQSGLLKKALYRRACAQKEMCVACNVSATATTYQKASIKDLEALLKVDPTNKVAQAELTTMRSIHLKGGSVIPAATPAAATAASPLAALKSLGSTSKPKNTFGDATKKANAQTVNAIPGSPIEPSSLVARSTVMKKRESGLEVPVATSPVKDIAPAADTTPLKPTTTTGGKSKGNSTPSTGSKKAVKATAAVALPTAAPLTIMEFERHFKILQTSSNTSSGDWIKYFGSFKKSTYKKVLNLSLFASPENALMGWFVVLRELVSVSATVVGAVEAVVGVLNGLCTCPNFNITFSLLPHNISKVIGLLLDECAGAGVTEKVVADFRLKFSI